MLDHRIFDERPVCQERMIRFLEKMGYTYVSRSEAELKRGPLNNVLFKDEIVKFMRSQHYTYLGFERPFSDESIERAVKELDVSLLQGLALASKEVYNLLTLGISVEERIVVDKQEPVKKSFDLKYIDFERPENNIWQVTEEFTVERANGQFARPDIVIMCNGIPIVVIECKKSSVDIMEGVAQNVRNMKPEYIPQLFKYAQLLLAVKPEKVLYGTAGTAAEYFVEWREDKDSVDWQKDLCEKYSSDGQILEQDRICVSLLEKNRLLDIIKYFIIFDNNIKKVCRHQQYFAVNKTMARINGEDNEDSQGGVIWHTQGSGKSLTMVMLVKRIQIEKAAENPRFIIITDRKNLDKQIKDNFANASMEPVRAATGKGLKTLLKNKSNVVITTLINKFTAVCRYKYLEPDSEKFYVLIDEAHRSEYGGMFNYMRDVLPKATLIAFTGTPLIAKAKKNTYQKFGAPIHNYTMDESVRDGITVPLVYEGRKIVLDPPSDKIDVYFDSLTEGVPANVKEELAHKFSRFERLAKAQSRLNVMAFDICDHFVNYCIPKKLKAMVVCSSRAAAVQVYDILKKNEFMGVRPKVVITFGVKSDEDGDACVSDADIATINGYRNAVVKPLFGVNDDKYYETVCGQFKDPDNDEVNILIVKDMLLTGFDAPVAGVLYVDKSMKEHNLLQAIARVNRVHEGKDFGLIIDYRGIFTKLNKAIDLYSDAESGMRNFDQDDIKGTVYGTEDEKARLKKAYSELIDMFPGYDSSTPSAIWQSALKDEAKRKEFYDKFRRFAQLLNLALTDRALYVAIGFDAIETYRQEYLFFRKLKDSVMIRNDDPVEFSKYESGIKNLIDTFVNSSEVLQVVSPVSIGDKKSMAELLKGMDSNEARADAIKTRIESSLKQIRYDDPLKFEEFSAKIRKTIEEYDLSRDADKYYREMEILAEDFRQGISRSQYPSCIASDGDSKAFYGSIAITLRNKNIEISEDLEEIIASYAVKIKEVMIRHTKRDWKQNIMVHKDIHRALDDVLFDMFDDMGITIDKNNVDLIDLIIDEIMKVAVARF